MVVPAESTQEVAAGGVAGGDSPVMGGGAKPVVEALVSSHDGGFHLFRALDWVERKAERHGIVLHRVSSRTIRGGLCGVMVVDGNLRA
jgi:hypothetical protein